MAEVTYPFTDDVSGRVCDLVIPPHGNVFAVPGQPKIGVRHPDCDAVADLCMDLDAFYCPACKWNGRISGAWAADVIGGVSGGEDDFVQDRHADLDAGESGGAMTDAGYYDRIAGSDDG